MALTDEARRRLFTTLVSVLGEADAVSLMDELPPPGEGAVSKAHIDARFDAVDQRFNAVERRIDEKLHASEERLEARFDQRASEVQAYVADRLAKHTRVTVGATVAMNAATIGVVLTALGAG